MKNENRYLLVSVTLLLALAFVLFGCVFANAAAKSGQERYDEAKDKNVCEAGGVFDLLTPKVVEFYERKSQARRCCPTSRTRNLQASPKGMT